MAQRSGVIFDMDGVLVASGPVHRASWQALARKHDIEMSDDAFADSFGRTSRDIVRMMWGDQVSSEEVQRYDSQKEAIYRDLITGMVPLTIGAREVLSEQFRLFYRPKVAFSPNNQNGSKISIFPSCSLDTILRQGSPMRGSGTARKA